MKVRECRRRRGKWNQDQDQMQILFHASVMMVIDLANHHKETSMTIDKPDGPSEAERYLIEAEPEKTMEHKGEPNRSRDENLEFHQPNAINEGYMIEPKHFWVDP
ncbi:uncharacterized protein LOC112087100 [Eutrema salsugineum]|uniref:uncharacterized protein LOC112087100 n=1 Tax=Eutrema salsugineum TaxID=72664 RepID=UPI000CED7A65|nr:uncharacterized protein LOC112087100 [Eutrema salsugineum]